MRRILSLVFAASILMSSCVTTASAAGTKSKQGYVPVYVDGVDADPDKLSYYEADELYVPLESVSKAMGSWFYTYNSALRTASLMAEDMFLTVSADSGVMTANGQKYEMSSGMTIKNGTVMVPADSLCDAFGAELTVENGKASIDTEVEVEYKAETKTESVKEYKTETKTESVKEYKEETKTESVKEYKEETKTETVTESYSDDDYDSDDDDSDSYTSTSSSSDYDSDVYWLSHIIYSEAGDQSYEGMVAVGNVVLNRVNSSSFPNNIYDVIFQSNQFEPVSNGTIYQEPSATAIRAAEDALAGYNVVGNALYFNMSDLSSWASQNRTFITQIGCHNFYA